MQTFIVLGILIFSGKLVSYLSEKIHLPPVTGMIALGILLGPTVIGLIEPSHLTPEKVFETLTHHHEEHESIEHLMEYFPKQMSFEIIHFLALVGVVILLFNAGLETDLKTVAQAGKISTLVALGGLILPFALGFGISLLFSPGNINKALFIGTILTATSVSVSAISLMALKKLQTREGTTILTAAIIDDVIGIIILSIVIAVISGDRQELINSIVLIIIYMITAILFGWFIIPMLMNFSKMMNIPMSLTATALALMLIFAGLAELSKVAGITGAYLAGMFIARTKYREQVMEGIETIGNSIFIPLFFIFIGLQINLRHGPYDIPFITLFVLAAVLGKIFGSGIMAYVSGFSLKRSFTVGSGMVPRGEVALVIASIGLSYPGVLDTSAFTATVILVIVSSLITPIFLEKGFGSKGA